MLLIQVKRSRRGTTLVVVDPGGDAHACADPDELWDTVQDLLSEDFGTVASVPALPSGGGRNVPPQSESSSTTAVAPRRAPQQRVHVVEEVPPPVGDGEGLDPFTAALLGFVGEHGAKVASGAVETLRGVSHRGPSKKRRRRPK